MKAGDREKGDSGPANGDECGRVALQEKREKRGSSEEQQSRRDKYAKEFRGSLGQAASFPESLGESTGHDSATTAARMETYSGDSHTLAEG